MGPGKSIDTDRFFVVCANYFGGCYGSTGPSSITTRPESSIGRGSSGCTGGVVNGPAIGFLARGVGLTWALGLVAAASALIAVLGSRLAR